MIDDFVNPALAESLLQNMLADPCSMMDLARRHGLTLTQILAISDDPELGEQVQRVMRLGTTQGFVVVAHFRYAAAMRLVRIASGIGDETVPPIVAVKACTATLTIGLSEGAMGSQTDPREMTSMFALDSD